MVTAVGITSGGGFSMTPYYNGGIPWPTEYVDTYLSSTSGKKAPQGYFKTVKDWNGSPTSYEGSEADIIKAKTGHFRAYPDLSLAGSAIQMVNGGKVALVDGASVSAPIFAGMLAALISHRKAGGLQVNNVDATHGTYVGRQYKSWNATRGYRLGWLNPTLYANHAKFHDVTVGNNTDGRGVVCPVDDPSYYSSQYTDQYGDERPYVSGAAGFEAAAGWDPVSGLGTIDYPSLRDLFPVSVVSVVTDADDGCVGCDYYEDDEDAENADTQEESSPSPPPYYGGYSG